MTEKYASPGTRASYGIGRQMGAQLASQTFEGLDPTSVAEGLIDVLNGKESAVSERELNEAFSHLEQKIQAKNQASGSKNHEEGITFLESNGKREGIVTLDSGLQYEVINQGDGKQPTASSTVKTHYHGTLISGEVFDSSVQRGQPAEFPVSGVIAGWTEALQLMPIGSKWRLFIPSNLAYGERGAGGQIGPNTALIFEVELLDIVS